MSAPATQRLTNPRDARVFREIDSLLPPGYSRDLTDELMPYIKRRMMVGKVEQELWERIEAWYGMQGLRPLTDPRLDEQGVKNLQFLGVAWVVTDE